MPTPVCTFPHCYRTGLSYAARINAAQDAWEATDYPAEVEAQIDEAIRRRPVVRVQSEIERCAFAASPAGFTSSLALVSVRALVPVPVARVCGALRT